MKNLNDINQQDIEKELKRKQDSFIYLWLFFGMAASAFTAYFFGNSNQIFHSVKNYSGDYVMVLFLIVVIYKKCNHIKLLGTKIDNNPDSLVTKAINNLLYSVMFVVGHSIGFTLVWFFHNTK